MIRIDHLDYEHVSLSFDYNSESIILQVESVIRNFEWGGDIIINDEKKALMFPLHLLIRYFEIIKDILLTATNSGHSIEFSDSGERIWKFVFDMLSNEPEVMPELSSSEIQKRLTEERWNNKSRSLTDFQLKNLQISLCNNFSAIFSVPGAGKTVEALAYSTIKTDGLPHYVIICPRNAFSVWENEINICNFIEPKKIKRVNGNEKYLSKILLSSEPPRAILMNYNFLMWRQSIISEYLLKLRGMNANIVLIIDESHWIKGGKRFTSAVHNIAPYADFRLILSGTPMTLRPEDLIPQYQALIPQERGDLEDDIQEYAKNKFVRTTKKDLGLKDPEIKSIPVKMDDTQSKIYNILISEYERQFATKRDIFALNDITQLSNIITYLIMHVSNPQLQNSKFLSIFENINPELYNELVQLDLSDSDYGPKIRYACNRARILASEGKKVIIWSHYVENILTVARELEDIGAEFIYGDVPTRELYDDETTIDNDNTEEEEISREQKINKFKSDPECYVLVANPESAGEGISLHDVCHDAI